MSVESVRVSIEALRCLRGCERLEEVPRNVSRGRESVAEAKKVPVEVVRESVRKSVLKNSGTHQNVLVLYKVFKSNGKVPLLYLKILEHTKTFWFCFKVFRLKGKVPILFVIFWNRSKRFGFGSKF